MQGVTRKAISKTQKEELRIDSYLQEEKKKADFVIVSLSQSPLHPSLLDCVIL